MPTHFLASRRIAGRCLVALISLVVVYMPARAASASTIPELSAGFQSLYNLQFDEARSAFADWQRAHPDDPMGSASEAASDLFEEFYKQGVLTSEFFMRSECLLGGIDGKADPERSAAFLGADQRTQDLAHRALRENPRDPGALLALTIAAGMRADFAGVIEKHPMESLRLVREAENYARRLLAVAPDASDAYVALGMGNYIIGCLPAYKRALVRIGGIHGDRPAGMRQLALAASQGSYLRPYAKIMLAFMALREKQIGLARTELQELITEFPRNPLFPRELAKLSAVSAGGSPAEASRNH